MNNSMRLSVRPMLQAREMLVAGAQPARPLYIGTTGRLPTAPVLVRDDQGRYDWVLSDLKHDVMYQRGIMGIPKPVMRNLQRPEFKSQPWELVIAHEIDKVGIDIQPSPHELSDRVLAMPNVSTASAVRLDRSLEAARMLVTRKAKRLATAGKAAIVTTAVVVADPILLGALPSGDGWDVYVLAVW